MSTSFWEKQRRKSCDNDLSFDITIPFYSKMKSTSGEINSQDDWSPSQF